MRVRFCVALLAVLGLIVASLPFGATASAQGFQIIVTDSTNVRAEPNTTSDIVTTLEPAAIVEVTGQVGGEEVNPGNASWFRTANGNYIYSSNARPSGGTASSAGMSGRWIEVDRSDQIALAMEDGQVVYTAAVTVGVPAFETPVGTYTIIRRVLNETMDSSTVGIPIDSPNGYYLTDVLYTQYFLNGYAIHSNYWTPDEVFGTAPASSGCIGMRLADAEFFWNFADIGTPIIITQ